MEKPAETLLRQTASRWIQEIWCDHNLDYFEEMHHPEFIDHSPAGRGSSLADYKRSIIDLYISFPDFSAKIEDLVIDENTSRVAIRWSARATHQADFLGNPPSNNTIFFQGIEIISIDAQGRITERWGEWDGLNLLAQLTHN